MTITLVVTIIVAGVAQMTDLALLMASDYRKIKLTEEQKQ